MEALEPDSLTKSARKKKELESQALKNNRKISDFFKTPEKQVDKQKQRSLLQFFTKSGQENADKSDDNTETSVDEVVVVNGEITTPTNSDKENSEVLEENEVPIDEGENSLKSKKLLKERGSESLNDEIKNCHKGKASSIDSERKKHKKKSKSREKGTDNSMSDSVIVLSDSSLSQTVTNNSEIFTENEVKDGKDFGFKSVFEQKTSDADENKFDTNQSEHPVAGKTDIGGKSEVAGETDRDSNDKDYVCSKIEHRDFKEAEKDNIEVNDKERENRTIVNVQEGSDIKTEKNGDDVSEAANKSKLASENAFEKLKCRVKHDKKKKGKKISQLCETTHLKSVTVKEIEKKCDDGETIDTVEISEREKQRNESVSVKSKSKKSTLKGKDMLNLLKEIQSEESDDSKKRTRKRKHKHHKIKEHHKKDVLEIAVSEDNSDGKEETTETKKHCKEIGDKLKAIDDFQETAACISVESEINKKLEDDFCQVDEIRRCRKNRAVDEEKVAVNNKPTKQTVNGNTSKVKKEKRRKKTQADKESVKGKTADCANQLSYEDFTETLDGKALQIPEKKNESGTNEMSYTEYLQRMEAANGGDTVDSHDGDDDNINNAIDEDDKEKILKSSATAGQDAAEDELKPEKSSIKKFFSVMTSTPDREKTNKKGKKRAAGKEVAVRKCDSVKMKAKTSHETDCEIIETKMDIDEKISIETIESHRVESNAEIPNIDTSTKTSLSLKKTQATLSFGRTGLTVLKPVSKSDEEDSKNFDEKSVKIHKCDNQGTDTMEVKKTATPGRGRKSRKETFDLNSTDSSVFATPENVKKRRVKRKLEEEEDSESAESAERRRSLRKRYKVEAFQMDADKKTPIKIKLKRCPKSSSSEDGERSSLQSQKVKVNAKLSTAQALLEKAKRGKLKKNKVKSNKDNSKLVKRKDSKMKSRNESNSSEDSITRRSSRLEGKVMASMEEVSLENIVISSSEDEGQNEKPLKKRGRPKGSKNRGQSQDVVKNIDASKGTPMKDTVKIKTGTPSKNKTPSKKAGMKLAPMFMMGKTKPAEPSPKKILDPETLKQRQAFLMSGVPDTLRKQTATKIVSQIDADYPPIPKTSHVLQVPENLKAQEASMLNVWDLRPVELLLRQFILPVSINPAARFTGDLIVKDQSNVNKMENFKDFKVHTPIPDDIVELCLKEIASFNATYPVTAMYKALKEMKVETEKPPPKSESMLKTDMKGILDGCTDMVVIDDEEDMSKKKKKKSLKLQKKAEKNIDEIKAEESPKLAGSGLLWTEKYCPAKTGDVLGNYGVLKKLKTWLTEWKHVLDREARKARKLLMKKYKGKQLPSKKDDDDLWDDGSDFDLDSDDSDDDDSLINTMLLTGPHGCGKTSSVYALALELGFKVHEVNASSCRSGKQILSQLQEATQSHQVSSQGNHTPRKNTVLGDKPKAEHKMPAAFTNLFQKVQPATENKKEEKLAGKKRKRNTSEKDGSPNNKRKTRDRKNTESKHKSLQLLIEDSSSQNVSKSLNLSSTTLILFDEVDVVFDEDRGFLSAIQNFMSNTKIPIILTTADPGFTRTFEGRYEQMIFKRPSVASITTHLQTVSLVENVRTDPVTLAELAQGYHCDMRKCLVAVQFLVESGGGHTSIHRVIQTSQLSQSTTDILGLENENSQSSLPGDSCIALSRENKVTNEEKSEATGDLDNSGDDFVTIKPLKKRRRVLDDDNSNSVDACLQVAVHKLAPVTAVQDSAEAKNYPPVHSVGLESLMSRKQLSMADSLTQGLKTTSEASLEDMICSCCCIKRTSDTDLLYNNLHILLPFSTQLVDSILTVPKDSNSKTKSRKRIRIQSDLYDSEASNDASNVEETESSQEEAGNGENDLTKSESTVKGNSLENLCIAKSLSCFTRFYDTMSSLDVLESRDRMKDSNKMQTIHGRDVRGTLVAGVGNELATFRAHCEEDLDTCRNYSSEIEARSMCKLYNETSDVKDEIEKLSTQNETFTENFVLPVRRQSEHFTLRDNSNISVPADYRRACDNTVDNLPLVSQSHLRTIHLDYLPTLREICRFEQCRQMTNTKRRFHHYLNNITLPLKDRTMSTLATTFI